MYSVFLIIFAFMCVCVCVMGVILCVCRTILADSGKVLSSAFETPHLPTLNEVDPWRKQDSAKKDF